MPTLVKEEVIDTNTTTLSSLLDAIYNRDYQQVPSTTAIDTTTSLSDLLNTLMEGNQQVPATSVATTTTHYAPPSFCSTTTTAAAAPLPVLTLFDNDDDGNDIANIYHEPLEIVPTTSAENNNNNVLEHNHKAIQTSTANDMPNDVYIQARPAANDILYCFDDILLQWMDEILRIEGKFKSNTIVKGEVAKVVDRMLQDGLISLHEHEHLTYTNELFIRLHNLIHMNSHSIYRRDIINILATLFEMQKITKTVFIEMCVNI